MRNFGNRFRYIALVLLGGCSGFEQSEQENLRRMHLQGEKIYRTHDEVSYPLAQPTAQARDPYPWENG